MTSIMTSIKTIVTSIISVLAREKPLIYAAIAPLDIIVVDDADASVPVAAIDKNGRMFLNKNAIFEILSDHANGYKRLAVLLAHEALHAIFQHPARLENIVKAYGPGVFGVASVAADAKIDQYLREVFGVPNDFVLPSGVTLEKASEALGIPVDRLRRLPFEAIVEEVLRRLQHRMGQGMASMQSQPAAPLPSQPSQQGGQPQHQQPQQHQQQASDAGTASSDSKDSKDSEDGKTGTGQQDVDTSDNASDSSDSARGSRGSSQQNQRRQQQKQQGQGSGQQEHDNDSSDTVNSSSDSSSSGKKEEGEEGGRGQDSQDSSGASDESTADVDASGSDILVDDRKADELARRGERVWQGDRELWERVRELLKEGRIEEAAQEVARAVKARARALEALRSAKPAGTGKGMLARAVDELSKGRYDWKKLLKHELLAMIGRDVRRTWTLLNKKLPEKRPGLIVEGGCDHVLAAIDVSGSISDHEYKRMAEAVVDAAKELKPRRMTLVWWDDGVREVRRLSGNPARVKREFKKPVPGGGGTSITDALEKAEELARKLRRRLVVILASDWHTTESPEEIAEKLARIKKYGARIAIVATPEHKDDAIKLLDSRRYSNLVVRLPPEDPLKRSNT